MEKCSFYSDGRTPVNRTACSTHGDRHPIACAEELSRMLESSQRDVERLLQRNAQLLNENEALARDKEAIRKQREVVDLQVGEARRLIDFMRHYLDGNFLCDGSDDCTCVEHDAVRFLKGLPEKRAEEHDECAACQQRKPDVLSYCSDCYHAT